MFFEIMAAALEKETDLTSVMKSLGTGPCAYWTSYAVSAFVHSAVTGLLLVSFGNLFEFPFFVHCDALVLIALFTSFTLAQCAQAHFLCKFTSSQRSAQTVCYGLMALGFLVMMASSGTSGDLLFVMDDGVKIPSLSSVMTSGNVSTANVSNAQANPSATADEPGALTSATKKLLLVYPPFLFAKMFSGIEKAIIPSDRPSLDEPPYGTFIWDDMYSSRDDMIFGNHNLNPVPTPNLTLSNL